MWPERTPREAEESAHQGLYTLLFMMSFVVLATLYGVAAHPVWGWFYLGLESVLLGLLCVLLRMSYHNYLTASKWRLEIELFESKHRNVAAKHESVET